MSKLDFVDTHFHVWDLNHRTLYYEWLQPDFIDPMLGERTHDLKTDFLIDDYLSEIRDCNVVKAVHVEAAFGSDDPVEETEWLQHLADTTGFPHAIVARTNLKSPDVVQQLERHCQYANVRGIRDFSEGDYLLDSSFQRGFEALGHFGLVSEMEITWEEMGKAADLARKFPDVTLVIEHGGLPQKRTDDYFASWRKGMQELAEVDNVVCKISGLGMGDHSWTEGSIRPWVLGCIEAFGVERAFFGTNWPVDRLYSSYGRLIDAYIDIISGFSPDEQVALLSGNAERVYRL